MYTPLVCERQVTSQLCASRAIEVLLREPLLERCGIASDSFHHNPTTGTILLLGEPIGRREIISR